MIYCGKRGSGKTVRLLKQAQALLDDGITPVFLDSSKERLENVKNYAERLGLNIDNILFYTLSEFKNNQKLNLSNYRIFIDELEFVLKDILNIKQGIYGTIDEENIKMISRSEGDKTCGCNSKCEKLIIENKIIIHNRIEPNELKITKYCAVTKLLVEKAKEVGSDTVELSPEFVPIIGLSNIDRHELYPTTSRRYLFGKLDDISFYITPKYHNGGKIKDLEIELVNE